VKELGLLREDGRESFARGECPGKLNALKLGFLERCIGARSFPARRTVLKNKAIDSLRGGLPVRQITRMPRRGMRRTGDAVRVCRSHASLSLPVFLSVYLPVCLSSSRLDSLFRFHEYIARYRLPRSRPAPFSIFSS